MHFDGGCKYEQLPERDHKYHYHSGRSVKILLKPANLTTVGRLLILITAMHLSYKMHEFNNLILKQIAHTTVQLQHPVLPPVRKVQEAR